MHPRSTPTRLPRWGPRALAALFKAKVRRGRVIEWHDTNHMFFNDPKHSDEAALAIRKFLLTK